MGSQTSSIPIFHTKVALSAVGPMIPFSKSLTNTIWGIGSLRLIVSSDFSLSLYKTIDYLKSMSMMKWMMT